ncbi:MAG TPA: HEAT repeat domain-containing protein [Bryobacteraceae bacterium]|nr:HEAT repeat domain-containing protein [Bryobacteraceae bacterium]
MRLLVKPCWFFLALLAIQPAIAGNHIGDIEFFGYKGLDIESIRKALPVHQGDENSEQTKSHVRRAVVGIIHREPTDLKSICCDEKGNVLLFIGLPGASSKPFTYNPEPTGNERLPPDIMGLYRRLDRAIEEAVRKGSRAAQEDDSNGYALINDPTARSLELEVRRWAVEHGGELLSVLNFSSSVEDRRVASDAVGYMRQSRQQILALVHAARDPDDEVRNNATRALGVLAKSNPVLVPEIPPDTFIDMLNSGIWTDRNKGASLLMHLTAARDPVLLAKIRTRALDSLIEMARWRDSGHAYFSRIILGRIAGRPEDRLDKLAWSGPVEKIIRVRRPLKGTGPRYEWSANS